MIVLILSLLLSILSFTYAYVKYRNTTDQLHIKLRKRYYILAGIFLAVFVVLLSYKGWRWYRSRPNVVAEKMLMETDPVRYGRLCDRLIESRKDSGILSDYRRMKAERPAKEVQNFCGNAAKSVLGRA